MDLETAQSLSARRATPEDIERAFADNSGRGEYIILTADDGSFIQAAGEMDDPYALEYHDAPSGKHFRATKDVTKEQVEAAFLEYLRGAATWKEARDWKELESSGCFAVLFLVITVGIYKLAIV